MIRQMKKWTRHMVDEHPYLISAMNVAALSLFILGGKLGYRSGITEGDQRVSLVSKLHQYQGSNEVLRSTAYDPSDSN